MFSALCKSLSSTYGAKLSSKQPAAWVLLEMLLQGLCKGFHILGFSLGLPYSMRLNNITKPALPAVLFMTNWKVFAILPSMELLFRVRA